MIKCIVVLRLKTFNGEKKNGYLDTDDTFVRWSDFHDIWWLLKEPFVFGGKPTK